MQPTFSAKIAVSLLIHNLGGELFLSFLSLQLQIGILVGCLEASNEPVLTKYQRLLLMLNIITSISSEILPCLHGWHTCVTLLSR
jgi:hypothetical protein